MKAVCQGPSQVAQRAAAVLQQASAGAEEGGRAVPAAHVQTTEALRNFPLFVLNLEIPANLYDVTYEVTKTTIAFRDEDVRCCFLISA
jgi:hypothetical protein